MPTYTLLWRHLCDIILTSQVVKMNSVPLCQQDLAFICGQICEDEFLASLYYRDEKIEVNEYVAQFSTQSELTEIESIIRNLPVNELEQRILRHADLMKNFRHFLILKLEPYDESETLDVQNVPFLLSKTANIKRYDTGNFFSVSKIIYHKYW